MASEVTLQVSASSSPCSSPTHSALPPSELLPNASGEVAGQPSNLATAKVGPADFNLLRVVGQGAFGKVTHHEAMFFAALALCFAKINREDHAMFGRSMCL